jgi:hypothetical protein
MIKLYPLLSEMKRDFFIKSENVTMGNEMVSATHSSKIHSEKWSHKPNHVSREHGNLLTTEESGLTSHSGRYEHRPSGLTVYRDVALTK